MATHRSPITKLVTACALAVLLAASMLVTSTGLLGADLSDLPRANPEDVGMSSARLDRVSAAMQRYIDEELLAGTVTLIARHGKVVHLEAQGLQDKQVMISDAARSRREPAVRPVTVRHVLSHTSGLSLTRAGGRSPEQPRPATLTERIDGAAAIPLNFQPGDEWQYGTSTDFVAILVEKISGESLDVFLKKRLFEPLGMDDTHYYVPESKLNRVATVYSPNGPGRRTELFRAPTYREPRPYFGGQAGLNSTAPDYFRFHQMMLNGGDLDGVRILSPRTVNLMISNHVGDNLVYVRGPGYGFGLGYGILMDPGQANEHLSPESFMWGGAWGTVAWVDPVEDMLGVFMTQITSYSHLNVRLDFSTGASQAIIKTNRHNPPTVMGYEARRWCPACDPVGRSVAPVVSRA